MHRKHWILASIAAITLSSSAFAETAYEKQIAKDYPGAKTQIIDTKEVNGVKVHDIRIEYTGGQAEATITDNGDYLLTSNNNNYTDKDLPPDVKQVSDNLFGAPATNVERIFITEYIVGVNDGGRSYDLKIDGTGRLHDVDTKQAMALEDPHRQPKAAAGDVQKISDLTQKMFPGAKIVSVNKSATSPGFYAVEFNENGQGGWVVINEEDRVRSYANSIPKNQAPQAVVAAISHIKGAKLDSIQRYNYRYWQFDESQNGDVITMKVRPDGDVISVESREAKQTQEAATASHKQHAATAAKKAG